MSTRFDVFGIGISPWLLATLLVFSLPTDVVAKGPPSGGGGGKNKVSVTNASPAEANQGEELDVVISGEGFDDGSAATFFISGTDDDTQITVLANEYLPSTGQLKARIRVQGAAAVTDYDIEVRNSRGRRGKGKTLFAVKKLESACTGLEDKDPSIAYVGPMYDQGDYLAKDIMLSSTSGCDEYVLLEAAARETDAGVNSEMLAAVRNLRLDIRNGKGIVIWIDTELEPWPVTGLRFELDPQGHPIVDPAGPQPLYLPPQPERVVSAADVRINDSGQIELVVQERHEEYVSGRQLVTVNTDVGTWELIPQPNCDYEPCFEVRGFPWWSQDGTRIYVEARNPVSSEDLYARFSRTGSAWTPELIIADGGVSFIGLGADELLMLRRVEFETNKGGKVIDQRYVNRIIDPELCIPNGCAFSEGIQVSIENVWGNQNAWVRDGGILFPETGANEVYLRKFANPLTGEVDLFRLSMATTATYSYGWDTSY